MSDNHSRRATAIVARLEDHARRGKMVALTASDAGTLARHIRELTCLAENRLLLAETAQQNPTLSSLRARERAGQEV